MSKPFYLKIAFEGKIKKYAVNHIKKINFKQIHQHLGLGKVWTDSVFRYQVVNDFIVKENSQQTLLSQSKLFAQFCQSPPEPGSTVKLRILQRELMSQQQKKRKESEQSFEVPESFQKKRSKSLQLDMDMFDQTCQTEVLQTPTNFSYTPTNSITHSYSTSNYLNQQQSNHFHTLQNRKFFAKSTQVSDKSLFTQLQPQTNHGSFTKTTQFKRIQNCLHQSIRITEKQKTELEKLKDKIRRRSRQLQKTFNLIPNVKSLLEEIGLIQQ